IADPCAGNIHLIERLHGGETRGATPIGFFIARCFAAGLLGVVHSGLAKRFLIRIMVSAARAASPPLLSLSARARSHACSVVLTVMMPLPSGSPRATARSISARDDSIDTI